MKYNVVVNKKFRYVKVYAIKKKINENTNFASKAFQKLVDRYLLKRKNME